MFAGSLIALLVAIFALLSLVPAVFALKFGTRPAVTTPAAPTDIAADRASIQSTESLANQMGSLVVATTTPVSAIMVALSDRPVGIVINHISYNAGAKGIGQIVLTGSAKDPSQINAYQDALLQDSHFMSASVPVDALVGAASGQFAMTVTGHF